MLCNVLCYQTEGYAMFFFCYQTKGCAMGFCYQTKSYAMGFCYQTKGYTMLLFGLADKRLCNVDFCVIRQKAMQCGFFTSE